jgi:phenylacetate-CoA ligase
MLGVGAQAHQAAHHPDIDAEDLDIGQRRGMHAFARPGRAGAHARQALALELGEDGDGLLDDCRHIGVVAIERAMRGAGLGRDVGDAQRSDVVLGVQEIRRRREQAQPGARHLAQPGIARLQDQRHPEAVGVQEVRRVVGKGGGRGHGADVDTGPIGSQNENDINVIFEASDPMLIERADFAPLADLAAHRQASWERQRDYVAAASPLHRRAWGAKAAPGSLAALGELPFTDKEMLRVSQRDHPPLGDYLAAPETRVARIHRTSGTSGTAMNIALSAKDAHETAIVGARAQAAGGLGPGHRVVHCLNYKLWMGGYTDHATLEATGAAVIPFGVGDTELLVRTVQELKITAISCTPSYPAVLERVIAEKFPGLKPRDLGLKLGLFGGEAGLDNIEFRQRLKSTWGFEPRNSNYGVSDVFCNFAGQSESDPDLHFMALDVLHPELIQPDTGAVLPWQEGSQGELVLTHVSRECQPLVRFRTGDIVLLTGTGTARCGRTAPRFRVVGRSDDMVVVRGLNAFPAQVAAILNREPALSGEYRIVLDGPGPYALLPVEAELAEGNPGGDALAEHVAAQIKRDLGLTARVTLLPFGALPRTEGKTRRVIRKDSRK